MSVLLLHEAKHDMLTRALSARLHMVMSVVSESTLSTLGGRGRLTLYLASQGSVGRCV